MPGRHRQTRLNRLLREDGPEACKRAICAALRANNGVVYYAAYDLGISRHHLYRYIVTLDLYPAIDRYRKRRQMPLWLAKTVKSLRGVQMTAFEMLVQGVKGLSAEEVEAMLKSSRHALRVDTVAFAQALVAAAADA